MSEAKDISVEQLLEKTQSKSNLLWVIVAFLPLLFQLPSSNIPFWALGLIIGGFIANKNPFRWIALGWIISIFFPQISFLLLASCGALLMSWRDCIYAAILGFVISFVPMPGELMNMGTILIILGLFLIIYKRVR